MVAVAGSALSVGEPHSQPPSRKRPFVAHLRTGRHAGGVDQAVDPCDHRGGSQSMLPASYPQNQRLRLGIAMSNPRMNDCQRTPKPTVASTPTPMAIGNLVLISPRPSLQAQIQKRQVGILCTGR